MASSYASWSRSAFSYSKNTLLFLLPYFCTANGLVVPLCRVFRLVGKTVGFASLERAVSLQSTSDLILAYIATYSRAASVPRRLKASSASAVMCLGKRADSGHEKEQGGADAGHGSLQVVGIP